MYTTIMSECSYSEVLPNITRQDPYCEKIQRVSERGRDYGAIMHFDAIMQDGTENILTVTPTPHGFTAVMRYSR